MPSTPSNPVPAEWRQGLVVLAGAGLSKASPADVMSWWEFNDAVLQSTKRRTLLLPWKQDTAQAIRGLSLDMIELAKFSQILFDAFAAEDWFRLLPLLEGRSPNKSHWALAEMMRTGLAPLVLTTNFDSLIERALRSAGTPFRILVPSRDRPPSITESSPLPTVVKLHGTLSEPSSLIDLAMQKRAGFSPEWHAWLTRTFQAHATLVVGFSGYDLELAPDYLGFEAARQMSPGLWWLAYEGTIEVPRVRQLLNSYAEHGHIIDGRLPDYLLQYTDAPVWPCDPLPIPQFSVDEWFVETGLGDPEVCAHAMSRLLFVAGKHREAAKLRDTQRSRIYKQLAAESASAPPLVAPLGQIGADELTEGDLDDARLDIETSVNAGMARLDAYPPYTLDEATDVYGNLAGDILNLANLQILQGEISQATLNAAYAGTLVERMPPSLRQLRRATTLLGLNAELAIAESRFRDGLVLFRQSINAYKAYGDTFQLVIGLAQHRTTCERIGELIGSDLLFVSYGADPAVAPPGNGPSTPPDRPELLRQLRFEWVNGPDCRLDEVLATLIEYQHSQAIIPEADRLLENVPPSAAIEDCVLLASATATDFSQNVSSLPRSLGSQPRGHWPRIVHPELIQRLGNLAAVYGNHATKYHAAGEYDQAIDAFAIASAAYRVVGDPQESLRCDLYKVDGFLRLKRYDQAETSLNEISSVTGQGLVPSVVQRRARLVTERALADYSGDPADFSAVITELDRLAKLIEGTEEASLVAMDSIRLLEIAGCTQEALERAKVALAQPCLPSVANELRQGIQRWEEPLP